MSLRSSDVPYLNFDAQEGFDKAVSQAQSHDTKNFVLDFNSGRADCAFDVDASQIKSLLEARAASVSASTPGSPTSPTSPTAPTARYTRWIHIWRPEIQKDFMQAVTKHYNLSPRLSLSMLSDPMKPQPVSNRERTTSKIQEMREMLHNRSFKHNEKDDATKSDANKLGIDLENRHIQDADDVSSGLDLNHYRIVNELWHFMSVDWGHQYTSIGYNALYNTKVDTHGDSETNHARPKGTRIWWWIVVCNDDTVLSIQENPFPGCEKLDGPQQRQLEAVRYNSINVFKQLSNVAPDMKQQNPILTTIVRSGRFATHAETRIAEEDSSSLLLYYLFDDWYSIYSLVAKSEHQYRLRLDEIRKEMFRSPEIRHVHRLHSLGRQLGTLKRMYEGYELIISRVMNGPQGRFHFQALKQTEPENKQKGQHSSIKTPEGYGVPIREPALLRFERLADRLKLYALSEIQSCLEEKETLMAMNFNLIAIKEESYVERLTRITILLAKFTILFLPVSLMATYFTIPLANTEYTVPQFWTAFAVIFFISSTGLVVFGFVSGTREAAPIYRSLTRSAIDGWDVIRGKPAKSLI